MLIHHFLENSSDSCPDKIAVIHGNKNYTYKQIEQKANAIGNWLLQSGIRKGDRVAMLLTNSIHYIYSYYGILKTGAIAVPLNTGLDQKELLKILNDSEPKILVSEKAFSKIIAFMIKGNGYVFQSLLFTETTNKSQDLNLQIEFFPEVFTNHSSKRPKVKLIDQDLSSIIYTSGSTGTPKGVVLSHLNIVTNSCSIISYIKLTSDDRVMVVLPFYYVYGKTLLNTHFAVSGSVIIDNRFMFPNVVLKNMIENQATGFSGVPSTFSILLNRSAVSKMEFPSLRYLTQAGGHMPLVVKKEVVKTFSDKEIFIMYGATEASARLSYLYPSMLQKRMGSIGKAIPNVELEIFNDKDEKTKVDEEGEIVARGSNIMAGYWNSPEESKKVLKNNWYYTGDIGVKDSEGFLFVTGRKKDMIKTGVYKVSAKEIEEILFEFSGVSEAAVIGVPDDILGEAINAYVVSDDKVEISEILEFCKEKLESYKVPQKIVRVSELPKNESGKIMKKKLTIQNEKNYEK